jgi:hypothetical protein
MISSDVAGAASALPGRAITPTKVAIAMAARMDFPRNTSIPFDKVRQTDATPRRLIDTFRRLAYSIGHGRSGGGSW